MSGVLYWVAVCAVALVLVVGLILFFESRDTAPVEESGALGPVVALSDARLG